MTRSGVTKAPILPKVPRLWLPKCPNDPNMDNIWPSARALPWPSGRNGPVIPHSCFSCFGRKMHIRGLLFFSVVLVRGLAFFWEVGHAAPGIGVVAQRGEHLTSQKKAKPLTKTTEKTSKPLSRLPCPQRYFRMIP